jgi:dienelactone hydrolase
MARKLTFIVLLAALIPAGCAWLAADQADTPALTLDSSVRVSDHQLRFSSGPALDYRVYRPARDASGTGRESRPLVILAHGFLRDQRNMQGLAVAIAEAGYPVATLNARHDSPISGGHGENSQDMVALARHLKAERVIYAGFSAGGLAALLAAGEDAEAVGVLTLDLVDTQSLGRAVAETLQAPVVSLAGAPTNCNANQNAESVYQVLRELELTRFPAASHCDFESPSDWLCQSLCARPEATVSGDSADASGAVQARIMEAAVAGIQRLAGN